ncbi:MAG TPA: cytochrome oxidase subunit III [Verrucomicrobiales bacterium]|nr:cytochrome oxidase subunit III [Verrucomicrobiales bacterium]
MSATPFQIPIATRRSATGIPTGRLALWWVVASEIVIFGGLLVCYILYRLHHPEWAAEAAHTKLAAGALNTFVLLTSSLFVVLAHQAINDKQPDKAVRYLWYTIAGGLVFLMVKAFEYTTEISHGFTITKGVFWSFYYLATGLHATHVIAGMISMAVVASGVRKGVHLQRVEYVGIYWHFVDMVWLFLFPLFYIASGAS